jgi:opacity protein-like surface antigen
MRKTKWNVFILTSALALTFLAAQAAAAPQPGQQSQDEQAAKKETAPDSTIYRVSYKVNEVENGKTNNSRSYTLMAQTDKRASTRIGSQVPYSTGNGIQYWSVGMNIDCTLNKREGGLLVDTRLHMSTVASKENIPPAGSVPVPVFGDFSLEDITAAVEGKPAFVGSIDDVNSNRQYVIEVTVTEAK